jgi:polyisoprenoid-binding protein YceI
MQRFFAALCVMATLAFPSMAATSQWNIDPARSTAQFVVTHLELSDVQGTFTGISGSATIDDDDLSKSQVSASIDVSTLDTDIGMRDDDLKSSNFFDVSKYPAMTFQSTKIVKTGGATARMTGNLTLHGVTKEVTFDVNFVAPPANQAGTRRNVQATTTISRKLFGMSADELAIGDNVSITLDIELVKATAPPAPAH